jgi:GAF domain-containing protein
MASGKPVMVEDTETDPLYAPCPGLARLGGYRAAYSTPLIARSGEVLGTIATHFREPHRPPERQIRLVELYARQVADFIENARLRQASGQGDGQA